MHLHLRLVTAVVFACASLSTTEAPAAVAYYFNWYCPGCSRVGSGSSGREGPFGSPSACEAARASMGGSLNLRGCGPDCFYPQLCQSEGTSDAPSSARQSPAFPPPSIQIPPAPSYAISDERRAEEARRKREQVERGAQVRNGKEPRSTTRLDRRRAEEARPKREEVEHAAQVRNGKEPRSATRLDLAVRWRNAFSWYEVRKSAQVIDIVLVETCITADCSRKAYPNRPIFRGRREGDRLIGVVLIQTTVESWQNGTLCSTPAGEYPINGIVSGDGQSIAWETVQFPTPQGCRAPSLSLGTWRRGP